MSCQGGGGLNRSKHLFLLSIDICQFNMTSLLNSSEDKSRSISFRSIILIMIYAGTIILNLLAASVDGKFPSMKAQSSINATIAAMQSTESDNVVNILEMRSWISLNSHFRITKR